MLAHVRAVCSNPINIPYVRKPSIFSVFTHPSPAWIVQHRNFRLASCHISGARLTVLHRNTRARVIICAVGVHFAALRYMF